MEEHMRRLHLLIVTAALFAATAPAMAEAPVAGAPNPTTTPDAATTAETPLVPETSVVPETPLASEDTTVGATSDTAEPMGDAAPGSAEPDTAKDDLAWDQFEDPAFDPANATAKDTAAQTAAAADDPWAEPTASGAAHVASGTKASSTNIELTSRGGDRTAEGIVLGPQGIDDHGRLHTVAPGDTLWDLAHAYLGTAWVWPSVWIDNDDLDNPHLILPGDRIWITANEMRKVTAAEAESFLAPMAEEDDVAVVDEAPAAGGLEPLETEPVPPLAALETEPEDASKLEAFPVAVPGEQAEASSSGRQVTVSRRDAMGFVAADVVAGASSIVESPVERTFLAAGDPVVVGMGEGDVEVGDRFTIFKVVEEVRDVESNRILGHHVDILGWLEIKELTGDTSIAEIRTSYALIERKDRIMPRPDLPRHVTARTTPDAIEGKIVFLPSERTTMADGGYVYLNRGEFHGMEVGSELEVFDPGEIVNERARRVDVRTPDHFVARLVVVSVTEESSVAFVLYSTRELVVGDDVRPIVANVAQR
jgi:nucleoid-associated protein YgaU